MIELDRGQIILASAITGAIATKLWDFWFSIVQIEGNPIIVFLLRFCLFVCSVALVVALSMKIAEKIDLEVK